MKNAHLLMKERWVALNWMKPVSTGVESGKRRIVGAAIAALWKGARFRNGFDFRAAQFCRQTVQRAEHALIYSESFERLITARNLFYLSCSTGEYRIRSKYPALSGSNGADSNRNSHSSRLSHANSSLLLRCETDWEKRRSPREKQKSDASFFTPVGPAVLAARWHSNRSNRKFRGFLDPGAGAVSASPLSRQMAV